MAKKKKKNFVFPSLFSGLKEETVQGIWAIVLFVVAVFFILAALSFGGVVGNWVFNGLTFLLGIGYYLIPLLLIVLSLSFIKSLKRHVGVARSFGSLLFFTAGLGLIDLIFDDGGGIIGRYISTPLHSLFDKATIMILIALIVISLLIMLDARLSLEPFTRLRERLQSKKRDDEKLEEEEKWEVEEGEKEEGEEKEYDEDKEEDRDEEEIEEEKSPGALASLFSREGKEKPNYNLQFAHEGSYSPPPLSLLEKDKGKPAVGDVKANINIIKRTLQNFGINVEMDEVSIGPTVTRYALKPAEGVRLSKIIGLQNNLELALAAHPVRIEAPIPGKSLVGIEVPNSTKSTVGLATLLSAQAFKESSKSLLIALGKDIPGQSHFADLAKMPHVLIAGTTGSGKSVTIHALITSLLYRNSPHQLRFIMIDPKRVELTLYNNIPHLLTPVVTNSKKAILALKWAAKEMDRRYDILEAESSRDVESYHKNILAPALKKLEKHGGGDKEELPETLPYIVIVIDELADIMQAYPRELESAIVRLAQMSRAVGIHLILSTQRPSVNIITGLIKANIPARIALQVSSQIDSRTILDTSGAEKLLGAGDMLYLSGDMSKPKRIQAALISEVEVKKVVKYLKESYEDTLPDDIELSEESVNDSIFAGSIDDEPSDKDDDLYEEARETVIHAGKASTSYLQRKLRIGYSRAARLMDILEDRGVIGPADGSKPREILEPVFGNEEKGEHKK